MNAKFLPVLQWISWFLPRWSVWRRTTPGKCSRDHRGRFANIWRNVAMCSLPLSVSLPWSTFSYLVNFFIWSYHINSTSSMHHLNLHYRVISIKLWFRCHQKELKMCNYIILGWKDSIAEIDDIFVRRDLYQGLYAPDPEGETRWHLFMKRKCFYLIYKVLFLLQIFQCGWELYPGFRLEDCGAAEHDPVLH